MAVQEEQRTAGGGWFADDSPTIYHSFLIGTAGGRVKVGGYL